MRQGERFVGLCPTPLWCVCRALPSKRQERCEALPRAPQGNFLKKVSLTFKNFWTWCDYLPPRHKYLTTKITPRPLSCKHGSVRRYFYCLSCGQGRWENGLHKLGRGWRSRRPVQTVRYRFDLSSMFADLVGATIGRPSFLRTRNARPYGTRQSFCCANDYI